MVFDHAVATNAQDVDAVAGVKHLFEVEFFAVSMASMGEPRRCCQEGELGGAVFVGRRSSETSSKERALCLSRADALFFQCADVLERW